MPKFATFSNSTKDTAIYFCSDEEVTDENIKVGTFKSAEAHCGKILTPKICDDQSLARKIRDLAEQEQERNLVIVRNNNFKL